MISPTPPPGLRPVLILAAALAAFPLPARAQAPAAPASPAADAEPRSGWFTTSDGVRLHYLEAGSGPAVVLVPGWTMPASIWEPQLRGLAHAFRVVALDPRAQGESEPAAEGLYPERRARDIRELIRHLGLAPAVLVGWSLGVVEALTYVDEFGTEELRGVVLVDGFIGMDRDPAAPNPLAPMLLALQRDRRGFAQRFVRSMFARPQPEEYLTRLVEASLRTPTPAAVTLMANLMLGPGDWRPALDQLDRPLLYVVQPQLAGQAEMVRARKPGARVEIFHDAGHALFVDDAARFNTRLEEFARALPPAP